MVGKAPLREWHLSRDKKMTRKNCLLGGQGRRGPDRGLSRAAGPVGQWQDLRIDSIDMGSFEQARGTV